MGLFKEKAFKTIYVNPPYKEDLEDLYAKLSLVEDNFLNQGEIILIKFDPFSRAKIGKFS